MNYFHNIILSITYRLSYKSTSIFIKKINEFIIMVISINVATFNTNIFFILIFNFHFPTTLCNLNYSFSNLFIKKWTNSFIYIIMYFFTTISLKYFV